MQGPPPADGVLQAVAPILTKIKNDDVDKKGKQRVELIEVKPQNQTLKEKLGRSRANQAAWIVNQAKWEAARAYCKQKGIFFRIITEQDIFHNGKRR